MDNLVTEEAHYFHEGSSMRKIGDTYYYLYADMERGKPTALGYSTGKSPMGPFSYQGIIIDNDGCDPKSWNNHGSIECMNGQWYVFYHRCSRQMEQHRRLCIEKITILPDGTIPEVKMTSQGVGDPFAPGEPIMGYQACGLSGKVYIDVNTDEATRKQYPEKLTNIQAGDEIIFRYVRSEDGYHRTVVKASGSGRLTILLNGMAAGEIRVENGIQMEDQICAEAGEYELKMHVEEAESLEILEVVMD